MLLLNDLISFSFLSEIFLQIGWPTSVPTSEQKTFMQNVLREKVFHTISKWTYAGYKPYCFSCELFVPLYFSKQLW